MDKPSPHNPHMHDWLSPQSYSKTSVEGAFDPKQMMEHMSAGFGPMKVLTVQQMELLTLMSRRAQAYLGIPQRLSRCRTQSDLINEQMRFWNTAQSQYQDCTSRIVNAWSELFASLPRTGAPSSASGTVVFPKKAETSKSSYQADRTADLIRARPANARAT